MDLITKTRNEIDVLILEIAKKRAYLDGLVEAYALIDAELKRDKKP